jgi:diguanylate cyclase (GGDEF)-like protein
MYPSKKNYSLIYKTTIIILGICCLIFALTNFNPNLLGWKFYLFAVVAVLLSPKLTLSLPYSESHLSFADTIIFLVFILFGGEAAIILATLETSFNCFYLKKEGIVFEKFTIPFNIAGTTLSTTITYSLFLLLPVILGDVFDFGKTTNLVSILGILAISQFLTTSIFAAIFYSFQFGKNIWTAWKEICFSSSITQIVGAGLAGVFYKILTAGDILMIIVSSVIFALIYFLFRHTVNDINNAMDQSQRSQKEKAQAEINRRIEAEQYAKELAAALENEEKISEALLQSKDALEHAAYHDFLSDLPNRSYLVERLRLLMEIGIEISHNYFVLFLDLSRFKNINDRLGHTVGDRVIQLVGKRLMRLLRDEDTVARLGGDEFAIILNDISSIEKAQNVAKKLHDKLTQPFIIQGHQVFTDLHIGIAPFDKEHKTPEDILRDADIAMHYAKQQGFGVGVFTKELRSQFLEKITLEAEIRFAVERKEFFMHYQPIISLTDGRLLGFEALLRWNHLDFGFISPAKFIPIAEDTGLIIPITRWILQETCYQLVKWKNLSPIYEDLIISVNISGKHLSDETLIDDVRSALETSQLHASSLKLEITESIAMENPEKTIEILKQLKELGIKLSIDDFGTGYSSLNYLHRLPFDTLKIDRSFVNEVGENGENSEILRTIISLAKNLQLGVIAEGIETESQFFLLRNLECEYGQGYLMSKPLSKDLIDDFLSKPQEWIPFEVADKTEISILHLPNENSVYFLAD